MFGKREKIRPCFKFWKSEEGLHFRRKRKGVTQDRIVERFNAEAISREHKTALFCIPKSEGKHTVEFLYTRWANLFVQVNDDFSVRLAAKPVAVLEETRAQFLIVIYLAIKDEPYRLVFVSHGVVTTC